MIQIPIKKETVHTEGIQTPSFYKDPKLSLYFALMSESDYRRVIDTESNTIVIAAKPDTWIATIAIDLRTAIQITEREFMENYNRVWQDLSLAPTLIEQ